MNYTLPFVIITRMTLFVAKMFLPFVSRMFDMRKLTCYLALHVEIPVGG